MNTNEKILNAALELFSDKGYSATTTKKIAQKAKVNEVTLFRHFENKRGVFDAIITQMVDKDEIMQFFTDGIKNDLQKDLTKLSKLLFNLYKNNASIIKMIFMDDELEHTEKKCTMHSVLPIKDYIEKYIQDMYDLGIILDNPDKCMKFFFFNVVGYLMNVLVISAHKYDEEYFDWMVEKSISAISPKHS